MLIFNEMSREVGLHIAVSVVSVVFLVSNFKRSFGLSYIFLIA